MKTIAVLPLLVMVLWLGGCASTKPRGKAPITFINAFLEGKGDNKRFVLKFAPEVPQYSVVYDKDKKSSEIQWKASAKEGSTKDYNLSDRGTGVKRATLSIDSGNDSGTLTLFHDSLDSFNLSAERGTDLVVYPRSDPSRNPTSHDPHRKRVSLNVKNAPLDKLIRTIATDAQRNLILANTVTGAVTVNLQDVPYEQAIDMLLRPTSYRAEHMGDVTIIRSAKDDRAFKAFTMRHVDVGPLQKTIQDILTKDGQVSVDSHSNSIFVVDRMDTVKQIELALAQIDQEPRQVEVETVIMEVDKNRGIDFGVDFNRSASNQLVSSVSTNKLASINPTNPSQQGVFVGLTWQNVSALVSMLATNSKLDVLARPRIVAINDQEANIVLGSKLGYKTTTSTANGQVLENINFLTVGTQLHIKPHITDNNEILMYIKPEVSDGQIDAKTLLPSANTTTAETKVLARDGQTIVIGGLFRERHEKKISKVPLLGDLPLLGFLFGSISDSSVKTELIILLSPRLVTTQVAAAIEREGAEASEHFYRETGFSNPSEKAIP